MIFLPSSWQNILKNFELFFINSYDLTLLESPTLINWNFTDKTEIGIDSGGEYWLHSPGMGEIFYR